MAMAMSSIEIMIDRSKWKATASWDFSLNPLLHTNTALLLPFSDNLLHLIRFNLLLLCVYYYFLTTITMLLTVFTTILFSSLVQACAQHATNQRLSKRADGAQSWTYESTYNWGSLNSSYATCQTGMNQSPIPLSTTQGLSSKHLPTFSEAYSSVAGDIYNWGYGPAFAPTPAAVGTRAEGNSSGKGNGSLEGMPSMQFDGETVYLKGWHIHAPADHTVQGDRSKAEIHFVHADVDGVEKGVVAIRIDPGNRDSAFFSQFISSSSSSSNTTSSTLPGFASTERVTLNLDIMEALKEVNTFSDFWTYSGSLTSPPCTEGIRWWVARNTLWVGNAQMQAVLGVSTFSARVEQEVWLHGINE